jgi:L-threonylcarbamoyladenylate synthase
MTTLTGKHIETAVSFLNQGELVAIPTETVYGLAANALNAAAVLKIFETKGRPTFNPLIVHVHAISEFEKYANDIPKMVYELAAAFSPGPLTFVLPKKQLIPDVVTGGGETVALRIPAHSMTLDLLRHLDFPLAAPSANPFGYISPVTAEHVYKQMQGSIPYILDGGDCHVGLESTVVTFQNDEILVLRAGGITVEELKKIHPKVSLSLNVSSNPQSPGQLKTHYAPKTPFIIGDIETLIAQYPDKILGILSFNQGYQSTNIKCCEVLSMRGDLKAAASSLFAKMRKLDELMPDIILAEFVPEEGLGIAINDRLRRAAAVT